MRAIKVPVPHNLPRQSHKNRAETKIVSLGLQRSAARRRDKARGVADDTFGALAVRKHAEIEQLIEQTKYGE